MQHDHDTDALKRYLEENEQELCSLAPDAYDAISVMSHSEDLQAACAAFEVSIAQYETARKATAGK